MEVEREDFAKLSSFGQDLMVKLMPKPWFKVPGMRERIQLDLSRALLDVPQGLPLGKAQGFIARTVREALAWELENREAHQNAQVEVVPTEDPNVSAYLVILPDGTPCTTLTLEAASILLGVDFAVLRRVISQNGIAPYHVVPSSSEGGRYEPGIDLYACIDLERLILRLGRSGRFME